MLKCPVSPRYFLLNTRRGYSITTVLKNSPNNVWKRLYTLVPYVFKTLKTLLVIVLNGAGYRLTA
jgi:hypothetical protein